MIPSILPGTIVLGDTRDLHHHGCEAVLAQLIAGLTNAGLPPAQVLHGMVWEPYGEVCLKAPLVVLNGEGALHHSRLVVESVLTLAEKRRAARLPTALVNSSWFANTPEQTRRLAAFDLVAMRDGESRASVRAEGIASLDAPDLAIRQAMQWRAAHANTPRGGVPTVSDSTRPEVTRRLRDFAAARGWKYLPVLYPPAAARPGKKSRKIFRRLRLARLLGPLARVALSPRYHAQLAGEPSMDAYCAALTAGEGALAGRFHSVCYCLGLRVPVVAMASNTRKIESILTDAGLDAARRMVSLESLTGIPPFTEEEAAALEQFLAAAEREFEHLFRRIRLLVAPAEAAT
jgi:hypothetical protein